MTTEYNQRPIGAHRAPEPDLEPSAEILGGDEDLEIVGEANYQDALWAICGGLRTAESERRSPQSSCQSRTTLSIRTRSRSTSNERSWVIWHETMRVATSPDYEA
jgi:hypothetical protein